MSELDDAGPSVATILARRRRLMVWCFRTEAVTAWSVGARASGARRQRPVSAARPRPSMNCPLWWFAGVDLDETGAVIAARQAVVGPANGELFLT